MAKKPSRKSGDKKPKKKQAPTSKNKKTSWNWHHIISRAVGGPDVPENKRHCLIGWHEAWHQLFRLYFPSIIIRTIEKWTDEDGSLNKEKMGGNEKEREKNFGLWQEIFGDKTPAEAIKFVKEEFLPVEKKFLNWVINNSWGKGGKKDVRDV